MIAASRPMIASTHRISISAKPCALKPCALKPCASRRPSARAADDVGCRSTAAFLTVRSERDDIVGRARARRAIDIDVTPGIVRPHPPAQIRPVPAGLIVAARQPGEALIRGRIAAEIEVVEIERARKTLDLD